jgi:hypothetical protein
VTALTRERGRVACRCGERALRRSGCWEDVTSALEANNLDKRGLRLQIDGHEEGDGDAAAAAAAAAAADGLSCSSTNVVDFSMMISPPAGGTKKHVDTQHTRQQRRHG